MKPTFIIALLLLAVACNKSETPGAGAASSPAPGSEIIDVRADQNGFTPSTITLKKGESATLRFTRTTGDTCAVAVVFPDLKLTKELPVNQPVEVVIDTKGAKTLGFECGMGMYKSKVVIQ